MVLVIDAGYSVLNHNLSQSLPFLKWPGPENKLIDLEPVSYSIEDVSETSSKEFMKVQGQKKTK